MTVVLFVVGIAFLIVGAELLVRGASRVASNVGIPPLVIGLTVVAFGTSSPEFAVSIKSALAGQANIAVGNVIGSNIFNVFFILGLSALITPLVVSSQLVRLDVPLMILVSFAVLGLALDQALSRADGILLIVSLIIYLWFLIRQSRKTQGTRDPSAAPQHQHIQRPKASWAKHISMVVVGLTMLVVGSRWLVDSAVAFAQGLGVSELVVGLTIVAAGTSLPEVVTSIIAAIRGERDIAVGNVVGSNIFNLMGVLGLASVLAPSEISISTAVIGFDLPVMTAAALACLPIFFTGHRINRYEGALLLSYYFAYTVYLVMAASHHDALPAFSAMMLYFAIPLTTLTLLVVVFREARRQRSKG